MDEVMQINVGGTIFTMLKSTINIYGSYFEKLLSTNIPCTNDKNGILFIDRSPVYFNFILEYLRLGYVQLSNESIDVSILRTEANFYGLGDLEQLIDTYQQNIPVYDKLIKLNVKGTIYHVPMS